MLARDHYATLGVPPDSSIEEIKSAYRHLCRRYHPDINPGDPRASLVFERIEDAYGVLADPERRESYDRRGSTDDTVGLQHPDLGLTVGQQATEDGTYADLFRALKHHLHQTSTQRGADIETTVMLPLALAERGARRTIEVNRQLRCERCNGEGRLPLQQHARPCAKCAGTGQEIFHKGALSVSCPCADCGGDGLRSGAPCPACNECGLRGHRETLLVRVPPIVSNDQTIRVEGAGHFGPRGGSPGDLVVRCLVAGVDGFERQGPHLACVWPISIAEAVLGGRVEVPTIEGASASLRLPPGTQNGRSFRLRGRGLRLADGRQGDLMVTVEVRIPMMVDEDSKALIRQFAERNPQTDLRPATKSKSPAS